MSSQFYSEWRAISYLKTSRVSDEAMPVKEVSVVHFAPDILVARRCLSERVRPCRPLIDCIEGGHSLKEFLDDFPASRRRLQSNAPAGTCRLREQPTASEPEQLRTHLLRVSHLICIGYGCGDAHINQILREWLEFGADRKLEPVGPGTKTCPSFIGHLSSQVILKDELATDYLEQYALTPLSMHERLLRAGLRRARNSRRKKMGFA